ncbi:MAG: ABC transporter permease [Acidobacteria bacterium]|nr:ABC transporter permease [Acidobacteriota bacterium]
MRRAVLTIALHHLNRVRRNPGLILLLLAVPFTLAVIEYFAFGKTAAAGKLPPIDVLIIDEDRTITTEEILPRMFTSGPLREVLHTRAVPDLEHARAEFRKNRAAALIVFPAGLQEGLLEGRGAEIRFYPNPIQSISPRVVESVLEMLALVGDGLYREAREPLQRIRTFLDREGPPTAEEIAAVSAGFYEAGRRFGRLGALGQLDIRLERPEGGAGRSGFGASPGEFFAYVFPGLLIFALFYVSQVLAVRLLRDRMRGLQARLLTTPVSRLSLLLGGVLYLVTGVFALTLILGVTAGWIFGIEIRNPAALLLLGLGISVFIAGLQLTINGMAKTDRGASFAAGVILMVLALLGGSFIPAEVYPPFLRALAFNLPNGAAQQGMIDVLVHDKSFAAIGLRLATTWVWAAVLLGFALRLEGRRLRKG